MYPPTLLSPAIANDLGNCVALLSKRVVRELPLLSRSAMVKASSPSGQHVAAAQSTLIQADHCLQQDDISAADRLVQQLLQRLSLPQNAAFLGQPEPWLFLARLAFLRGDLQDAQTFLSRSMDQSRPVGSDRPVKPVDKHGRALHCCQFLLQSILQAHDGAIQAAWQSFNCVESASQIADGPNPLRTILLTRCLLELYQAQFVDAWKAWQAADLLRSTAQQSARQATSSTGAERLWLRQFAGLQQPAECN